MTKRFRTAVLLGSICCIIASQANAADLMESNLYTFTGVIAQLGSATEANIYTTVPTNNPNIPENSSVYYYLEANAYQAYNGANILVGIKEHKNPWWVGGGSFREYFHAYMHKDLIWRNNYYVAFGPVDPPGTRIGFYIHPGSQPGKWIGEVDVPNVNGVKRIPSEELNAGISDFSRSGAYIYADNGAHSATTDGLYHYFWGFGYYGLNQRTGQRGWWNTYTQYEDKGRSPVPGNNMYYREITGEIRDNKQVGLGIYNK